MWASQVHLSLTYYPMPSPLPTPNCLSIPTHHGMAGLERRHLSMALQLSYQHLSAFTSRFHLALLGHLPQTVQCHSHPNSSRSLVYSQGGCQHSSSGSWLTSRAVLWQRGGPLSQTYCPFRHRDEIQFLKSFWQGQEIHSGIWIYPRPLLLSWTPFFMANFVATHGHRFFVGRQDSPNQSVIVILETPLKQKGWRSSVCVTEDPHAMPPPQTVQYNAQSIDIFSLPLHPSSPSLLPNWKSTRRPQLPPRWALTQPVSKPNGQNTGATLLRMLLGQAI